MQHVAISDANENLFMNSIEPDTPSSITRTKRCCDFIARGSVITERSSCGCQPMWRDPSINLATRGFRSRSDLRRAIQVSVGEIRKLIGPIRLGATTISKLNRPLAMNGYQARLQAIDSKGISHRAYRTASLRISYRLAATIPCDVHLLVFSTRLYTSVREM